MWAANWEQLYLLVTAHVCGWPLTYLPRTPNLQANGKPNNLRYALMFKELRQVCQRFVEPFWTLLT